MLPGQTRLTNVEEAKAVAKILVVDDEKGARAGLVELLRDEGHEVRSAADAFKALGQLEDWTPDLVVTDVHMPGMDGIALMEKLRAQLPGVGVVVMTAHSTVEKAVEAMKIGADDYLTKPIRIDELLIVVERILRHRAAVRELEQLRDALQGDDGGVGWVGQSKASREIVQLLRQVADSPASVLILGESGTGKELAARSLHQMSSRRTGPFVSVHCAALAEGVLESELFGHEKGSFTGATAQREGRFAKADGGTLFLDEVGEIPPAIQVKLLRVLQERKFERVGGDEVLSVDVRLVAATNRDLHAEVRAGRFREDLFYRLNVINVRLPTLRERRDDIPLLAMHFLRRHAARNKKALRGFSERALDVLQGHDWPGNVRELENCIERAVVLCNEYEIEPRHLPREVMGRGRDPTEMPIVPGATMAEVEQYVILRTLESVGGSTSKAAKVLGISPRTIQYRMNEYREVEPTGTPAVETPEETE
jgi:two-component system response regulator HydG